MLEALDADDNKTTTTYTPASGGAVSALKTTNPLNQTTTITYEPAWGLPVSSKSVSGATAFMAYDPLGRLINGWHPGHSPEKLDKPDVVFEYNVSQETASVVTSKTYQDNGTYLTSYAFHDGLGRAVQTQSPGIGVNGGRVITDTFYDTRGLTNKVFQPYWNDQAPATVLYQNTPDNMVPRRNVTTYDNLERVTKESLLSFSDTYSTTTYRYEGDRVHTQPPTGGTATTSISDAQGRVTELWQYHAATVGGSHDVTRYTYTRQGQQETVTDPAGNVWRFGYDLRGRKITADDPDRGHTGFGYDKLGRLTSTTDARDVTTVNAYDDLGRRIGMYDSATTGTKLAEWTFDTTRPGLPASSTRFDNGQAYTAKAISYDSADRPLTTQYIIPAVEHELAKTYTYRYTYTFSGKLDSVQMPAVGGLPSERVVSSYDGLGLLESTFGIISGVEPTLYVSETDYSPYGEQLRTTFAHLESTANVGVTYSYEEETRRLRQMSSVRETDGVYKRVTDLRYSYDKAGNVLQVTDAPNNVPTDTQCLTYDNLRRLTEAWTPASHDCATTPSVTGTGGAAPYWLSWAFDTVGNRLTQTNHGEGTTQTNTYPAPGAPRPHAVQTTTTDTMSIDRLDEYGYDATGNTIIRTLAGDTQTLDYDLEGRLTQVTEDNGDTSTYVYSADGDRLIQREPEATTLYLPGMDVRRDASTGAVTATRRYTHNGTTIATRTPTGLHWSLPDRNGTVTTTVNGDATAHTKRYQDPYGNPRGQEPVEWPDMRGFLNAPKDVTGLTHLGARQYDPAIGRFLTVDPVMDLADPQQFNAYAYSNNSPVTHSDPSGLFCDSCNFYNPSAPLIGVNCPPCSSNPNKAQEDYDIQIGRNKDPKKQPSIAGRRVPTFEELRQLRPMGHGYGEGDNYQDAIRDWAYNTCMRPNESNAAFCSVAQNNGWLKPSNPALHEFLFGLTPLSDLADCAGGSMLGCAGLLASFVPGLKGAKAADDVLDVRKAPCEPNSFVAGTKVLMADGTAKPIEDVELGDTVLATDPLTGKTGAKTVAGTITTQGSKNLVTLTVDTGGAAGAKTDTIVATAAHPFWIAGEAEWLDAADIQSDRDLYGTNGAPVDVLDTGTYVQYRRVYNLTISDVHTYYVLAGVTPVLVHNSGPDCGVPLGGKNGDRLGGEGFHGSEYSLDEVTQFVNGHTGDGNSAMGRPSVAEVEATLRQAGPRQLEGQNSSRFDYNGVRVIVNWDMPWKSTAYYPGR